MRGRVSGAGMAPAYDRGSGVVLAGEPAAFS